MASLSRGQRNLAVTGEALNQQLILAINHQDISKVLSALRAGANPNAFVDDFCTVLHMAVGRDFREGVSALLAKGADIEVPDRNRGGTPLHHAALGGHREMMEMLLQHGASIDAKDNSGCTALQLAVSKHGTADAPSAAWVLIKAGADVNTADNWGCTPTHRAACSGNRFLLTALVEHGANASAFDINGDTPLHFAARMGNASASSCLLHHGADAGAKNLKGLTASEDSQGATLPDLERTSGNRAKTGGGEHATRLTRPQQGQESHGRN